MAKRQRIGIVLLRKRILSLTWARAVPLVLACSWASVAEAQTCGQTFLSQQSPTILFEVNSNTNPITFNQLGGDGATTYNALSYHPTQNRLLAMERNTTNLLEVSIDGSLNNLGPVSGLPSGNYFTGAFAMDGFMYVMANGGGNGVLYRIDVDMVTATSISLSSSVNIPDIAFFNGLFYGADTSETALKSIDPGSGAVTTVGSTGVGGAFGAMFGSDNAIFGVNNDGGAYLFDFATGAAALIADAPGSDVNDGSRCLGSPVVFAADVSVTKTDNSLTYIPGADTVYDVVVTNNGPFGVLNAEVDDPLPAGITTASWTCTGADGGVCEADSGSGAILDTPDLPASSSVTYTYTVAVPDTHTGPLTNTVTVSLPDTTNDPTPLNNIATDTDVSASTVIIAKETPDGDGTFPYTGDLGPVSVTTTGGSGSATVTGLNAGTYDVTESVPAGWMLDSIACSDGSLTDVASATATIDLAQGETVTCTFGNSLIPPEPGTITIAKVSLGGDGTFAYGGGLGPLSITTTGGTGSQTFNDLDPGTYNVTEIVPAGWMLERIACTDGSPTDVASATATIDLTEGEGVICAFENRLIPPEPGTIVIAKLARGANGTFGYSGDLGPVSITTSGGTGRQTFSDLAPGTYNVTETVPEGWMLERVECTDGSSTDVDSATATIDLAEGEGVICAFVNSVLPPDPGTITIAKVSLGGDGTFAYGGGLGPLSITTTGGTGSETFGDLDAGTYNVTEIVPAGWTLERIECSDGSSTDVGSATATIDLAQGETVTCTFDNRLIPPPPGTIVIAKLALGANGTFGFSGDFGPLSITTSGGTGRQTFNDLIPGTYNVTETVPEGWMLERIECTDGSPTDVDSASASIDLAEGEGVICAFVNRAAAPVPTLPPLAMVVLVALLGAATLWRLRRVRA